MSKLSSYICCNYKSKQLEISQKELQYRVNCDKNTGILTWKNPYKYNHTSKIGGIVGTEITRGWVVVLKGVYYKRDILVWLYFHGEFPIGKIVHKNSNILDDSLSNLKVVAFQKHEIIFNKLSVRHEYKQLPTYGLWYNMIRRCYNTNYSRYPEWGGRGIKVCKSWHTFYTFHKWAMSNGFSKQLYIDRMENDGNYSPVNCRFVSPTISICNTKRRKDNTSGYTGVSKVNTGFTSRICVEREVTLFGVFDSIEQAVSIRNRYIIDNNLPHKIQEV